MAQGTAPSTKKQKQEAEAAGTSAGASKPDEEASETQKKAVPPKASIAYECREYSGYWPKTRSNIARVARDGVTASAKALAAALATHKAVQAFMDDPVKWQATPVVLPPDFPSELVSTPEDAKMWKALPDMEMEVLKLQEANPLRERRVLFVRHACDQPPQEQEYQALLDVKMHHIAIGKMERESSKFGRGWELLRIDSDVIEMPGRRPTIKATYLAVGKIGVNSEWPANWPNYLFEPLGIAQPPVPGQRAPKKPVFKEWQEERFPVDCIMWSTEQKVTLGSRVLRIPVAVQKFALSVVKAIESGTQPVAQMPQIGEGEDGDD